LAIELKDLSKQSPFKIIQLAECLLWVQCEVEPISFLNGVIDDLMITKKRKTMFISRILPIESTCHASLDEIKTMTAKLAVPHFGSEPVRYGTRIAYLAIIPKTRNNTHMDRKKVIEAIASIIEPHHIVDLNNPQIVILVQVFKTVCGVGIVTDYYKRRALNLDEIAGIITLQKVQSFLLLRPLIRKMWQN
jgi:tRNA acetyltransferase TAN1